MFFSPLCSTTQILHYVTWLPKLINKVACFCHYAYFQINFLSRTHFIPKRPLRNKTFWYFLKIITNFTILLLQLCFKYVIIDYFRQSFSSEWELGSRLLFMKQLLYEIYFATNEVPFYLREIEPVLRSF